MPCPASAAPLTGERCRAQHTWGSSPLPPHKERSEKVSRPRCSIAPILRPGLAPIQQQLLRSNPQQAGRLPPALCTACTSASSRSRCPFPEQSSRASSACKPGEGDLASVLRAVGQHRHGHGTATRSRWAGGGEPQGGQALTLLSARRSGPGCALPSTGRFCRPPGRRGRCRMQTGRSPAAGVAGCRWAHQTRLRAMGHGEEGEPLRLLGDTCRAVDAALAAEAPAPPPQSWEHMRMTSSSEQACSPAMELDKHACPPRAGRPSSIPLY